MNSNNNNLPLYFWSSNGLFLASQLTTTQTHLYNRIVIQTIFVPCKDWTSINIDCSLSLTRQKEVTVVSKANCALPTWYFPGWALQWQVHIHTMVVRCTSHSNLKKAVMGVTDIHSARFFQDDNEYAGPEICSLNNHKFIIMFTTAHH